MTFILNQLENKDHFIYYLLLSWKLVKLVWYKSCEWCDSLYQIYTNIYIYIYIYIYNIVRMYYNEYLYIYACRYAL